MLGALVAVAAGDAVLDGDAVEGDAEVGLDGKPDALDVEDAIDAAAVDHGDAGAHAVDGQERVVDLQGAVGAVVGVAEPGQRVGAGDGQVDGVGAAEGLVRVEDGLAQRQGRAAQDVGRGGDVEDRGDGPFLQRFQSESDGAPGAALLVAARRCRVGLLQPSCQPGQDHDRPLEKVNTGDGRSTRGARKWIATKFGA